MSDEIDLAAVTQVQQKVWSDGDFAKIGELAQHVAEELCEELDVLPGDRALDIACGSGNGALAAARRAWGPATGLDYVPELLARARERAEFEGLDVEFVEGDAQGLPFEDGAFDVVTSIFGVMFAPDQQRAAAEILRVTKPGGRIGICAWTPEGWAGQMFAATSTHAPPPPGIQPPTLWGTEDHLRKLFGDGVADLRAEKVELVLRYPSPEDWLSYFRTWFGPVRMAFARVGPDGEDALEADLLELMRSTNTSERALRVPAEFLRTIAKRA